jgi:hypothetical protein
MRVKDSVLTKLNFSQRPPVAGFLGKRYSQELRLDSSQANLH